MAVPTQSMDQLGEDVLWLVVGSLLDGESCPCRGRKWFVPMCVHVAVVVNTEDLFSFVAKICRPWRRCRPFFTVWNIHRQDSKLPCEA